MAVIRGPLAASATVSWHRHRRCDLRFSVFLSQPTPGASEHDPNRGTSKTI